MLDGGILLLVQLAAKAFAGVVVCCALLATRGARDVLERRLRRRRLGTATLGEGKLRFPRLMVGHWPSERRIRHDARADHRRSRGSKHEHSTYHLPRRVFVRGQPGLATFLSAPKMKGSLRAGGTWPIGT